MYSFLPNHRSFPGRLNLCSAGTPPAFLHLDPIAAATVAVVVQAADISPHSWRLTSSLWKTRGKW